jgi:hypothetical protein
MNNSHPLVDQFSGSGQGRKFSRVLAHNAVVRSQLARFRGREFDDRGAHELKGVPGEWRLFAVASS